MIKKCFFLDDSPIFQGKYCLRLNLDGLPFPQGTKGSYNLLPARLLNLSYIEYLRYCRDVLGAELIGKNQKYVSVYFNKTPEVNMFIKLLNTRLSYVLNEYDFPYEYYEDGATVDRIPLEDSDENY